ncbi:hypothetical protein [Streptomyces sp. NPDC059744]|uniref:hypothetical protein n=1 Tax=Streptomyces sp. NPDC059744 TaxID=3346929 RepID=UPI0036615022
MGDRFQQALREIDDELTDIGTVGDDRDTLTFADPEDPVGSLCAPGGTKSELPEEYLQEMRGMADYPARRYWIGLFWRAASTVPR